MEQPVPRATPRTRLSREARARQLIDAAERVFTTSGFEGTSMEDIAQEAGVTRQLVYAHFPSKEDVFLACVTRARAELEDHVREPEIMIEAGADVRTVITRAGEVFFGMIERDPQRWMVLFNPGTALSPALAARMTEMRQQTILRIAEMTRHFAAFDSERNLAFAYAISGVGEQLGRWWFEHPDVPRDRVIQYYCDFVTAGLAIPVGHGDPVEDATVGS